MFILKINLFPWFKKIILAFQLAFSIIFNYRFVGIDRYNLIEQIIAVGPGSLGISIITACFIGLVFTLQVIKEFLYLDASSFIGAILSLAFIRELSPVLTAVIIAGRIGAAFTAEIATMKVTEQIDALYLLKTDPIIYLVMPRLMACVIVLPLLNLIFLFTSLSSSLFACFIFYAIHPWVFLKSAFLALSYQDLIKSATKVIIFGFLLSNISCSWGLTVVGGAKSIGKATTSSVVTNLLMIFIVDFILTSAMFNQNESAIKSL